MLQNKLFRVQQDLQQFVNLGKFTKLGIQGAVTNMNHLKKHNEDKRKILSKKKEDAYELVSITKIFKLCNINILGF